MKTKLLFIPILLILISNSQLHANNFWERTNGPDGGMVECIAVGSNDEIYVGTYGAGLYKSTDGGENWRNIPIIGNNAQFIKSVVLNKNGDIFVLEADSGVYRSTDNGKIWEHLTKGLEDAHFILYNFSKMVISSNSILYVATQSGIWVSTNNGYCWNRMLILENSGLYAITVSVKGSIFYSTLSNVFKLEYNSPKCDTLGKNLVLTWDQSLLVNDTDDIFLSSENKIYRGLNNGTKWSLLSNGLDTSKILYSNLGIDNYGNLFIGIYHQGIYISKDNGDSWIKTGSEVDKNSIFAFAFNSKNEVFACTDNGIYKSQGDCVKWQFKSNGLNDITDIFILANNNKGKIFAVTFYGIFRASDNGRNWTKLPIDMQNYFLKHFKISKNGEIVASTDDDPWYNAAILLSTDDGDNWQKINQNLNDTLFSSLAINKNGDIFVGTPRGLYKTTDKGISWKLKSPIQDSCAISAIGIDNNEELFAAIWDSHTINDTSDIYKSTDNGESWTYLSSLFYVTDISFDYRNRIYISQVSYTRSSNFPPDFSYSKDGGKNWIGLYQSGTSLFLNDNQIWIGAQNGAIYTINDGVNWIDARKEMTGLFIISMVPDDSGHVLAGTDYGGLFRSLFNPEDIKLLTLSVNPTDTLTLDLLDTPNITLIVKDRKDNPLANATIKVTDNLKSSSENQITDSEGKAIYQIKVPYEKRNGLYKIIFEALKDDYANKQKDTIYIRIKHVDTLTIDVEPKDIQVLYNEDWLPSVDYTAKIKDLRNYKDNNATLYLKCELNGDSIDRSTDTNAIAYYTAMMFDKKPAGIYNIRFVAVDDGYYPSDTVTRQIEVREGINDVKDEMNHFYFKITPNPIISNGKIQFKLLSPSYIKITINDLLGREILKLADGHYPTGNHELGIDSKILTSQVYFVTYSFGIKTVTKTLIIDK